MAPHMTEQVAAQAQLVLAILLTLEFIVIGDTEKCSRGSH